MHPLNCSEQVRRKMAKFIQEIRKGPSKWAKVTYVDVKMANFKDYTDFQIAN